jgi:hypothetical protein
MAIVLVVIGLILGMVYKGRALVAQGKVKKVAANYNKIIGAMNTFYDRYGFFPGDGCTSGTPNSPMNCTGTQNGTIDVNSCGSAGCSAEAQAFWHLLIDVTGILDKSSQQSVFGQDWLIWEKNVFGNGNANWLDLDGGDQADPRIICALDRMIDDGYNDSGIVTDESNTYTPDTDCWSMSGQGNPKLKILP